MCATALGGALAAASPVPAQPMLTLPGKTVEVIGFRRWSIGQLQDSLVARTKTGLDAHACAVNLPHGSER